MCARLALAALSAALLCACGSSSARPAGSTGTSTPAPASTTTSSAPTGTAVAVCGPSSGRTLATDARARVYVLGTSVYGCATGARTSYALGRASSCLGATRAGPFALAGPLVAYGAERCGVDTGRTSVVVRRLTDGQGLSDVPALSRPLGPESYVTVTAIVLASNGDAAWIAAGRAVVAGPSATVVVALDRHGVRELDSGPAVVTGGLELHGDTVRWRDGGSGRAATLA